LLSSLLNKVIPCDQRDYLRDFQTFWGYEFYRNEIYEHPFFGGAVNTNIGSVVTCLYDLTMTEEMERAMYAVQVPFWKNSKKTGKLYRSPLMQIFGKDLVVDEIIAEKVEYLEDTGDVSSKYCSIKHHGRFKKLIETWAKKRQTVFKERIVRLSSMEFITKYLCDRYPFLDFIPNKGYIYETEAIMGKNEMKPLRSGPNPILSYLARDNPLIDNVIGTREFLFANLLKRPVLSLLKGLTRDEGITPLLNKEEASDLLDLRECLAKDTQYNCASQVVAVYGILTGKKRVLPIRLHGGVAVANKLDELDYSRASLILQRPLSVHMKRERIFLSIDDFTVSEYDELIQPILDEVTLPPRPIVFDDDDSDDYSGYLIVPTLELLRDNLETDNWNNNIEIRALTSYIRFQTSKSFLSEELREASLLAYEQRDFVRKSAIKLGMVIKTYPNESFAILFPDEISEDEDSEEDIFDFEVD